MNLFHKRISIFAVIQRIGVKILAALNPALTEMQMHVLAFRELSGDLGLHAFNIGKQAQLESWSLNSVFELEIAHRTIKSLILVMQRNNFSCHGTAEF